MNHDTTINHNHNVRVDVDVKINFDINVNKNTDFDKLEDRILGGAAVAGLQAAQQQIEQVINGLLEEHNLENSEWSVDNKWKN